jgi:putative Mn2+ efflux pump MntP
MDVRLTPEVREPFTLRALVKLALWVGVAGLHAGVAVPLFALSPLVGMATIGCAAALLAGLGGLAGDAVTEAVGERLLQMGGGVVIGMAVWLPVSQLFAATPS